MITSSKKIDVLVHKERKVTFADDLSEFRYDAINSLGQTILTPVVRVRVLLTFPKQQILKQKNTASVLKVIFCFCNIGLMLDIHIKSQI